MPWPRSGDTGYTLSLMQQAGCGMLTLPSTKARVSPPALAGQQHSLQHS